ncbi:uncharacterized protein LY89DRAFT_659049 [Mollisia scopiformis]|uniref:CENP-C homolog n=1 Tax=Mollisia scopiformis TaxID=149040 RepID=A0A132B9C3_MOLSC|nr:uncharacterized protein LY89DRAFT_659049 [Mollisia scopiformis]KUJ08599.1 hypothetical protein LY89DRAFT_659049 [Mollisia scopiformis]
MAPQAAMQKRKPRENQYLFEVGVRGRKTGLTLPDTGIRDENGLEPMDHLFSSPEKPKAKSVQRMNGTNKNANATISSEEDMEVDENTIPEPAAVLNERKQASMRLPPPRSKSPIKTFLQSPARRHPSLGPGSSPVRPAARASSVSTSVRRRLDFSNASFSSVDENTIPEKALQKRAGSAMPILSSTKLVNGNGVKSLGAPFSDQDMGQDNGDYSIDGGAFDNGDDSLQMVNGDSEIIAEPEDVNEDLESITEELPEPEPKASKKNKGKERVVEEVSEKVAKRGRPKKAADPEDDEVLQLEEEEEVEQQQPKKRTRTSLEGSSSDAVKAPKAKTGRPKKVSQPEDSIIEEAEQQPVKNKGGRPKKVIQEYEQEEPAEQQPVKNKGGRPRKVIQEDEPEEPAEQETEEIQERPAKKSRKSVDGTTTAKMGRPRKAAAKIAPAKAKPAGRRPKLATIEEADSPAVQRGPPLPRTNNGLFILRRETPLEGAGFKQTRSGRNSIKPVAYWKNERIEYDEDEMDDAFGNYMLPRIKEVVRAEEIEPPKKRARGKSKAPKSKRATVEPESEDDDEVEPWEMEPGRIFGAVRAWDPEDPTGAEVEELEEEVALSSEAIQTRDIAGASFKFAKTLSYPFFGAGMVDLPPGGQKKPKNSRRMQMAFFVFYGRVKVIINDTEFRIGKGGMFQVPRGNFYSLENDYDKPARIFFSQGCELPETAAADSQ